jgi:nucleotide-binding universal stress UspA family protein
MLPFKRILFPVDFSQQSIGAAHYVEAFTGRFDAQLIVLHVIEPPSYNDTLTDRSVQRKQRLDAFLAKELAYFKVERMIAEGDPATNILKVANVKQADLIMMPTHGHGPFRALLLGSVTAKVLHDTHCLVWTGVHAEQMTLHSPDRWKRVLCAVNTETGTDEHGVSVLKWAREFAQQQNLDLQLVHAVAGADGMWTEESDPSMYEFLVHAARERLAKLQAGAGTDLDTRLIGGSVANAVHQAAVDYHADLIVIGRGAIQSSFGRLKNSASAIIRAAPCPVISI